MQFSEAVQLGGKWEFKKRLGGVVQGWSMLEYDAILIAFVGHNFYRNGTFSSCIKFWGTFIFLLC